MPSIRKTKKRIKKHPSGILWLKHSMFWSDNYENPFNEYQETSLLFYNFDVNQLVEMTGVSKERINKYIRILLWK